MGVPKNMYVDSNEYYDSLKELKDAALVASQFAGRRRRIGICTFGIATVAWRSEDGGMSALSEKGVVVGKTAPFYVYPTTLHLYGEPYDNGACEMVNFRMELDDVGLIRVTRAMLSAPRWSELVRAKVGALQDAVRTLDWPTNDDSRLLYSELERGASGAYSLSPIEEG
jgi:hypothetical protein